VKILLRVVSVIAVLIAAFFVVVVIAAAASEGGAREGVALAYLAIAALSIALAVFCWRAANARGSGPGAPPPPAA
jgi:hypothetical protein